MTENLASHFADLFESIAAAIPDRSAFVYGDHTVSWSDFDHRANALALDLQQAGVEKGSTIAVYVPNRPEYMETYHAAQKISAWPFNVNYRYGPDEIFYLFDNAQATAVVFDTQFLETLEAVRPRASGVKRWYAIGGDCPDWAVPYESVVGSASGSPSAEPARSISGRSETDVVLVYTGGTTGMPKGVMWQHEDLIATMGGPVAFDPSAAAPIVLLACPLMHATALSNAFSTLKRGGTVVLLPGEKFDAAGLWDTVDRVGAESIVIVGDAFARPLLAELDAAPGRWSLESLGVVHSAGVIWSREVKEGLLRHLRDDAMLVDIFGSSEAAAMGSSVSTKGRVAETASFSIGALAQVISENGGFVEPGSGEVGLAAFGGPMPVGYFRDEVKTAETFRTIDGRRWSVPGDFAMVEADGTMKLLGRGSVCINTGGEKVFVEEVEEVLKLHSQVRDAVCVGVADERFGQRVCAVVEPAADQMVDATAVIDHVKARLASYKAPRDVVVVESIGRAPSGKVDYKTLQALATERLATRTGPPSNR